ncbi:MAG: exo-alpha-sialidase [Pirellulales bacterium]
MAIATPGPGFIPCGFVSRTGIATARDRTGGRQPQRSVLVHRTAVSTASPAQPCPRIGRTSGRRIDGLLVPGFRRASGLSDDGGQSWRASAPLLGYGNIQPSVLRRRDGTLVALMRENGRTGKVRVGESQDDGETWGPVGTLPLANPGSGLEALVLRSGVWLLIHNDTPRGRMRLVVSQSTDESQTWNRAGILEDQPTGAFHYPAAIQSSDGKIHVVYSYFVEGGKSMKHVAFSEDRLQPAP